MLHIIKSKAGKFNIVSIGTNGNQTARSNRGFHHKAGAIENIRALMKSLKIPAHQTIRIQDNTTAMPCICVIAYNRWSVLYYLVPIKKQRQKYCNKFRRPWRH